MLLPYYLSREFVLVSVDYIDYIDYKSLFTW